MHFLGDGKVGHEVIGRGPVPVPLVGRGEDHVPGPHRDDIATLRLDQAVTFGDVEGLAERAVSARPSERPG